MTLCAMARGYSADGRGGEATRGVVSVHFFLASVKSGRCREAGCHDVHAARPRLPARPTPSAAHLSCGAALSPLHASAGERSALTFPSRTKRAAAALTQTDMTSVDKLSIRGCVSSLMVHTIRTLTRKCNLVAAQDSIFLAQRRAGHRVLQTAYPVRAPEASHHSSAASGTSHVCHGPCASHRIVGKNGSGKTVRAPPALRCSRAHAPWAGARHTRVPLPSTVRRLPRHTRSLC